MFVLVGGWVEAVKAGECVEEVRRVLSCSAGALRTQCGQVRQVASTTSSLHLGLRAHQYNVCVEAVCV